MRDTPTNRVLNPSLRESGFGYRALSVRRVTIMLVLWAGTVGAGLGYLVWYSNARGTTGAPPRQWPAGSAMQPNGKRPTLMMFIHPRCPCTQASLEGLAPAAEGSGAAASRSWEPMTPALEWAAHSAEPMAHCAEPMAPSWEWTVHSKERMIHSMEPMAHSLEPVTHSSEPMAHSLERMTRSNAWRRPSAAPFGA